MKASEYLFVAAILFLLALGADGAYKVQQADEAWIEYRATHHCVITGHISKPFEPGETIYHCIDTETGEHGWVTR